jgi:uncharacterized membrane protein YjgN (DUF898 family)
MVHGRLGQKPPEERSYVPGSILDREGSMSDKSTNPRFFYGYVVTAAGFGVWLICWGTFNPCFGVFLKPLLAEFGWTRAETALAYSLALSVQAVLRFAITSEVFDLAALGLVMGVLGFAEYGVSLPWAHTSPATCLMLSVPIDRFS